MDGDYKPPPSDDQSLAAPKLQGNLVTDFAIRTPRLDELEDVLSKAVTQHKLAPLTRTGQFDGGFQFHGTAGFGIFNVHFGRQLTADLGPEIDSDRVAVAVMPKGSGRLLLGKQEFSNAGNEGLVFSSGPKRTLQFSEDCAVHAIVMDHIKVAEYCAKLIGRDVKGQIEFDHRFPLETAAGQSWMRLMHYATGELSDPLSFVRRVIAAGQQLEQMTITGLLLSHHHNYSDALLAPQSSAAPFYVRRAEAYIEAHFSEALSLADIAAHAGVSARSLQNGFQSFRHTTPIAFLRLIRLQRVHQALLVADPTDSTVTEIALQCGFSHMGEFGSSYKRTFGVTPSQTLLRKN
jgi:AraC-like DNA-binding protein